MTLYNIVVNTLSSCYTNYGNWFRGYNKKSLTFNNKQTCYNWLTKLSTHCISVRQSRWQNTIDRIWRRASTINLLIISS